MTASPAPSRGFAVRSVAGIAAALPGATAVFRHGLDFRCGGAAPRSMRWRPRR